MQVQRTGQAFGYAFLDVVLVALSVLEWMVLIWVILSWILFFTSQTSFRWRHKAAFNIVFQLNEIFTRFTNPILKPFRRLLPPWRTGGVDVSPILLFLAILFLRRFLILLFYRG
jgi:YggT family protein